MHLNNHKGISQVQVEQEMGFHHTGKPLRTADPATMGTPAVAAEGSQVAALEATASHTEEEAEARLADRPLQVHQKTPVTRMASGAARSSEVVEVYLIRHGLGAGRARAQDGEEHDHPAVARTLATQGLDLQFEDRAR